MLLQPSWFQCGLSPSGRSEGSENSPCSPQHHPTQSRSSTEFPDTEHWSRVSHPMSPRKELPWMASPGPTTKTTSQEAIPAHQRPYLLTLARSSRSPPRPYSGSETGTKNPAKLPLVPSMGLLSPVLLKGSASPEMVRGVVQSPKGTVKGGWVGNLGTTEQRSV